MSKPKRERLLPHRALANLGFLLAACLFASFASARGGQVIVHPRETDAVLHNPDMGWTVYENYPLDQRPGGTSTLLTVPEDDFAGVDAVAVMFTWADIERGEGEYDFSKVDHACDYWRQRGKAIQLRMSTTSLLWWNNLSPPSGTGVPEYLLDRLPASARQVRHNQGIAYITVDARQPLYRERLEKFLAAVAHHFDDRRPVTLIDLRGFGLWGEWHSGFRYPSLEEKRTALAGILDRWSAAFGHHWLALSYSFDPDGSDGVPYQTYLRYSDFDHALGKPNITFRRDGCGGAVRANERRFADEVFSTRTRGPMSCEFVTGYAQEKPRGQSGLRKLIDDALSLHPNYINLLGYQSTDAASFLHEQPELIAYGLRNMGYRLVPVRIGYPAAIAAGTPAILEMTWTNRAVGRAMRDFHLVLTLADADGQSVASIDAGPVRSRQWIKGQEAEISNLAVEIPKNVPPGHYTLELGLRDLDGRPIALPLHKGRAGAYAVGSITVN